MEGPRTVTVVAVGEQAPDLTVVGADGPRTVSLAPEREADPREREHTYTARVVAAPGDELRLPGLVLPVGEQTGRIEVLQQGSTWRQVDLLPAGRLARLDDQGMARDAVVGAGALVLAVVVLVVLAPRRRGAAGGPAPGPAPLTVAAAGLAALAAALVGTWPMAAAGGALVQRNFDGFGSAWLLWFLGQGTGELPGRLDTLLFVGVGRLAVAVLDPAAAYHLVTMLGVGLSFAATALVASRVFAAGPVAALVAGLAYAWSPLAGTALVEGHGGWLLGPGLPLLIGALAAASDGRPWREAGLVVGAGVLCALQSGYVAVMAGVAVLVVGGLLRRSLWRIGLLALPCAALYAWLVLPDAQAQEGGVRAWAWYLDMVAAMPPSDHATLDTLLGDPPGAGLMLRHVRHPMGYGLLAGGLVVPLLRRDRLGLVMAALGLAGLVLALGPRLLATALPGSPTLASSLPYAWLVAAAPPLSLFRFPVRFLWLWYAAMGLGTARSLTWLSAGGRRAPFLLGLAVVAEALLMGVRPWESRTTRADAPSALQALQPGDVVYDLWPLHAPGHPLSLQLKELTCWYQVEHGAGLPVPCLDVQVDQAPLYGLHRTVAQALLDDGERPPRDLDDAGVTAVAWHPDAFSVESRARVLATATRWWGRPVAASTDGGEALVLWRHAPARGR